MGAHEIWNQPRTVNDKTWICNQGDSLEVTCLGWPDVPLCAGQSRITITIAFYTSCKLRRCPALLLTVRLDFWNTCFIIWHLSNSCVQRQQWGVIRGGAGCLNMSIKMGRGCRLKPRPPTRNNANQVRIGWPGGTPKFLTKVALSWLSPVRTSANPHLRLKPFHQRSTAAPCSG